jgi:hypothetical protein
MHILMFNIPVDVRALQRSQRALQRSLRAPNRLYAPGSSSIVNHTAVANSSFRAEVIGEW